MTKGTEYTVEEKEEIRRISDAGKPITIIRVWARSAQGTRFHVDLKEDEIAKADEILTARAKQIDAI